MSQEQQEEEEFHPPYDHAAARLVKARIPHWSASQTDGITQMLFIRIAPYHTTDGNGANPDLLVLLQAESGQQLNIKRLCAIKGYFDLITSSRSLRHVDLEPLRINRLNG